MRPRPDAAENVGELRDPAEPLDASMRPRPDAAENALLFVILTGARSKASMRPRPDAAENRAGAGDDRLGLPASMRPRPDAAENVDAARLNTLGGLSLQ